MNQVLDTLACRRADLEKIFMHYGEFPQLIKTVEELVECAAVISKSLHKHCLKRSMLWEMEHVHLPDAFYEEAADALIMLSQLCLLDPQKVSAAIDYKIDRTLKGIGSEVRG